ncbi:MAG: type II toxin-antitoxin system VapC family toxin [Betaproteobacteria bacterium]|nr:type II toxin-antitoxin system VapC family toxin [Betaproteobacteria bacterium]
MIYVDTSALVPVFIREPKSEAVIAWLESSGERLVLSEWCLVEFASAAALKVRTGQTAPKLARVAVARAREFARKHCTVAIPGRDEFRRAAELAGDDGLKLRAGDALHLAIAMGLNAQGILCLDDAMIAGARALGMSVVTI